MSRLELSFGSGLSEHTGALIDGMILSITRPNCGGVLPVHKSPLIVGGAGEKIAGPSTDSGSAGSM